MKLMQTALSAVVIAIIAGLHTPVLGQAADLRSAKSFAVLGATSVTNTGASTLAGSVGVSPGTTVTGFPPGTISNGGTYKGGTTAAQAQSDLTSAYNDLAGRAYTANNNLSGQDLGGKTLYPGVYHFNSAAVLGTSLVLNALGDRNAVFIIQVGSTLTADNNTAVIMTGGGRAQNVFWQVGGTVTLGTGAHFVGSILAQNSIALQNGATLDGRALSRTGSVSLNVSGVSAVTWQAIDIAEGSDNLTRALWTDGAERMVVWTMDNSGSYSRTQTYGPYTGCSPIAIASGADGITRVLWTNVDGAFYLWHLNKDNSLRSSYAFAPLAGWYAVDVTVASDNKARILASDRNGSMMIWTVDTAGTISRTSAFGPFTGRTPTRIAAGTDGLTRIIWSGSDGTLYLWHMNLDNSQNTTAHYGPYTGWSAVDISVGSDNRARILWAGDTGYMKIWSVTTINGFVSSQIFGPVNAWRPLSITSGADSLNRVMWNQNDAGIGIWNMNLDGTLSSSFARRGP